jgi:hypothetical protein
MDQIYFCNNLIGEHRKQSNRDQTEVSNSSKNYNQV